jgi:hypothetical protein
MKHTKGQGGSLRYSFHLIHIVQIINIKYSFMKIYQFFQKLFLNYAHTHVYVLRDKNKKPHFLYILSRVIYNLM